MPLSRRGLYTERFARKRGTTIMKLSKEEIKAIIPHRDPMLLVLSLIHISEPTRP